MHPACRSPNATWRAAIANTGISTIGAGRRAGIKPEALIDPRATVDAIAVAASSIERRLKD
jgi:hypothetical protein